MRKRLQILLLALIMVLSGSFASIASAVPADTAGTAYEAAVLQLYDAGVLNGYPDGTFKPFGQISRAEACKMVVLATGEAGTQTTEQTFIDLKKDAWAAGYIERAVEMGIVKGYPDGTFRPGAWVSENELLAMILRAMGHTDGTIGGVWPANYVALGDALGVTAGTGFTSADQATRGMAALLTYNGFFKQAGASDADLFAIVTGKSGPDASGAYALVMLDDNGTARSYSTSMTAASGFETGDIVGLALGSGNRIMRVLPLDSMYSSSGKFDGTQLYAGKPVDPDAVVFTFGADEDFKTSGADFSDDAAAYGVSHLRLMRNVTTPCYYVMDDDKIVAAVVPGGKGYSGRMYGLILEIADAVDAGGDSVEMVDFLIGRDIVPILTNGDLDAIPDKAQYDGSGELYEITLRNGVIRGLADANGLGTIRGDRFVELTAGYFMEVEEDRDSFMIVADGSDSRRIDIMNDAVYYIMEDDGAYAPASASALKEATFVRAYDVTDDGTDNADILVIADEQPAG